MSGSDDAKDPSIGLTDFLFWRNQSCGEWNQVFAGPIGVQEMVAAIRDYLNEKHEQIVVVSSHSHLY